MVERKSIIVYYKSNRVVKELEKIGNVAYSHSKKKYSVVYVDGKKFEEIKKTLKNNRAIKRYEISLEPINEFSFAE